ncbi:MAG TPA: TIM barrel protein [Anseongella sp.]|nr:TIM barrel protein [Anseongella sp.]
MKRTHSFQLRGHSTRAPSHSAGKKPGSYCCFLLAAALLISGCRIYREQQQIRIKPGAAERAEGAGQDHLLKTSPGNVGKRPLPRSLKEYPLFVFNNGVQDEKYDTPQKQVQLLRSLGYQGMEKKGIEGLAETLEALDKYRLELYTMYLNVDLDNREQPYDQRLREVFRMLKGRPTMPWFYITSRQYPPSSAENDSIAVPILQEIADMAAEYGTRVMIYPHIDFWVDNVDDAVRVAGKVNRPNLGIAFNLCHFLARQGPEAAETLEPAIEKSMPYLFAISLNGADQPTVEIMKAENLWKYFIQPLGQGDYDTFAYLRAFIERGFKGPVGLQCFNLKEEKAVHLGKSILAWRDFGARMASVR